MTQRAAIMTRISNNEPSIDKVGRQEERCRKLAADNAYDVVAVFTDDGFSAYDSTVTRPAFEALLEAVHARQFDVILATTDSRLARNEEDGIRLKLAAKTRGVTFHTIDQGTFDPGKRIESLLMDLRGYANESQSEATRALTRRAKSDLRTNGVLVSAIRPFGWDKISKTEFKINKPEADLVRAGVKLLLGGGTRWDAVRLFNASGLKTSRGGDWRPISVYAVLQRGINAGLVEHTPRLPNEWDQKVGAMVKVYGSRAVVG
jgi:site-specific DNA recombinase